MSIRTGIVCATLLVLIQGCKIVQSVSSGGHILSGSGTHDCPESRTCEIDVPNGEPFTETFTAIPRYGYAFAGWRGTESYLCAGNEHTCTVNIPASVAAYDATGHITAEFYHQPQLVYPGTVAMEFGIWSGEVELDAVSYLYAGDFDADGDDDACSSPPQRILQGRTPVSPKQA